MADYFEGGPAQKLNVKEDALYRILRLLASQGIFEENSVRCFSKAWGWQLVQRELQVLDYFGQGELVNMVVEVEYSGNQIECRQFTLPHE